MDIRSQLVEGTAVDLQELHIRIAGRNLGKHVVELETDGDDDLGASLRGSLEVLPLGCRIGALVGLGDAAERLRRAFRSDLAKPEEVVDADRIGRDVDEQGLVGSEA